MKRLILLAACFPFFSCSEKEGISTIDVGGRYSIELPDSFKHTKGLNEDASLEYQDAAKELYVIVIDEAKSEFDSVINANSLFDTYPASLDGYSQLIIDGIDPSVKPDTVSAFEETTINRLKARMLFMKGVSSGYNIFWKFAFIEGKNRYYQVMAWTLDSKKKVNEKYMDAILTSFKETDRSKK